MRLPLVLLGCGRWGRRVLAALLRHPRIQLVTVVDPSEPVRQQLRVQHPGLRVAASLDEGLSSDARAAYIATPSALHQQHALSALALGYDVLVEKPLCGSLQQAQQLEHAARRTQRLVMAGHLLRFHPAYEALLACAEGGLIGKPRRVFARRVSTSGVADMLSRLAPHDLATLYALDGSQLVSCRAIQQRDAVEVQLRLASGLRAQLLLSTRGQQRQRQFRLIGDAGELLVDELDQQRPLRFVHAAGNGRPPSLTSFCGEADPLGRQLDHFVECVETRSQPRTDLREAQWTVAAIEQARSAFRAAGIAAAV